MKKLILIGIIALGLTGCTVKGDYSASPILEDVRLTIL